MKTSFVLVVLFFNLWISSYGAAATSNDLFYTSGFHVVGHGRSVGLFHPIHEVCPVACDRARKNAFKKAQMTCDRTNFSVVVPIHGGCSTMTGTAYGCKSKYPLEFNCQ